MSIFSPDSVGARASASGPGCGVRAHRCAPQQMAEMMSSGSGFVVDRSPDAFGLEWDVKLGARLRGGDSQV